MVKFGTMVGFALLLLLAGCFDVRSRDPGIELLPDSLGRVGLTPNGLGISGYWYAYGDQYDYPSRCTTIGMHHSDECSHIYTPTALPKLGFTNTGGRMCTAGQVARVLTCANDTLPGCEKKSRQSDFDYSNMWGAGIGLDFGLEVAAGDDAAAFVRLPLDRSPWDATMHHIAGVSFDFSWLSGGVEGAPPHIRVEFPFVLPDDTLLPDGKATVGLNPNVQPPVPATGELPDPQHPSEEYPSGSPIWGVTGGKWGDDRVSPVREGYNEVRFDSLGPPPETDYVVDVSRLLGIQFHIPTWPAKEIDYDFCISNLALFRD